MARDIVRQWSEEEFFADALPPTDDDVPIALDGRVLDSPEKVIAYLDEINRRRVTSSSAGLGLGRTGRLDRPATSISCRTATTTTLLGWQLRSWS